MEASNTKPICCLSIAAVVLIVVAASLMVPRPDLAAEDTGRSARVSKACLDCHEGYDAGLALTPHHVSPDAPDGPAALVACTDCHGGDSRHFEEDPKAFPMINPSTLRADSAAVICSKCHIHSHQQNMLEANIHAENNVNCTGCHRIHQSTRSSLLKNVEPDLCLDCHAGVEGQFAQSYRHPVNDQIVKCSECHQTLDATSRGLSRNGTNVCLNCHGEFRGPFLYEHQATVDYSTEEGACITCHEPHGSAQPRMLKQPYEPPHYQLCTQCHSVPAGHQSNAMHGTTWAEIPCNECHTDIHGSYINRYFLGQSLQGRGCLAFGCHQS